MSQSARDPDQTTECTESSFTAQHRNALSPALNCSLPFYKRASNSRPNVKAQKPSDFVWGMWIKKPPLQQSGSAFWGMLLSLVKFDLDQYHVLSRFFRSRWGL